MADLTLLPLLLGSAGVASVLTALVAWLLSGWSARLELRREHRRRLSRALADLLEIRFRIRARRQAMEWLGGLARSVGEPPLAVLHVLDALFPFLKADPTLAQRFNAAVEELAGADPVGAYLLRGRDMQLAAGALLGDVQQALSAEMPDAAAWFGSIQAAMADGLDDPIRQLARQVSRRTGRAVERELRKPVAEMPPDVQQRLAALFRQAPRPGDAANAHPALG